MYRCTGENQEADKGKGEVFFLTLFLYDLF